jgi:hypothetical protein
MAWMSFKKAVPSTEEELMGMTTKECLVARIGLREEPSTPFYLYKMLEAYCFIGELNNTFKQS